MKQKMLFKDISKTIHSKLMKFVMYHPYICIIGLQPKIVSTSSPLFSLNKPLRGIWNHLSDFDEIRYLSALHMYKWIEIKNFVFPLTPLEGVASTQIESCQPRSSCVNPNRVMSTQIKSRQPKSSYVNPNKVASTQIKLRQPKLICVNPNQIIIKTNIFHESLFS